MMMAILIGVIVTFLVFCAGVAYIAGKIKYIHIQLEDTIDMSKNKIINAVSRLFKRDRDMVVPEVEVMSDELITRIEAEKIHGARKGLRGKD